MRNEVLHLLSEFFFSSIATQFSDGPTAELCYGQSNSSAAVTFTHMATTVSLFPCGGKKNCSSEQPLRKPLVSNDIAM